MKIAFYTLGCKTNQFETQALEQLFKNTGHQIVPFDSFADVYIVNTCTVTALSDKKSRNAARKAKKINANACLIVCGCYSQINPNEVRELTGADIIIGTQNKGEILQLAQDFFNKTEPHPAAEIALPAGGLLGRTRALLKVQDGCQNYCTYCIIPYARGKCRSITIQDAAKQAAELANAGYSEIVITGIEVSSYGIDLPDTPSVADLVQAVCHNAGSARIRLSSLEPRTITPEFLAQIQDCQNLCPHFHLSLQSGCDATLLRMNRKYTAERFMQSCELLRKSYPGCAITTDLIVGFAGETTQDFEESVEFIKKCKLAQIHVFPYSRREGTRAFDFECQIAPAEKSRRAKIAGDAAKALRAEYLKSKIGTTTDILFEQEKDGFFGGHAPEYFETRAQSEINLQGEIRTVLIKSATATFCVGEII